MNQARQQRNQAELARRLARDTSDAETARRLLDYADDCELVAAALGMAQRDEPQPMPGPSCH